MQLFMRKFSVRGLVQLIDVKHSSVSISFLLIHLILETVSVSFYVWISLVSEAQSLSDFHWTAPVFITEVVLNIIFFLAWIIVFLLEEDKRSYSLSLGTLVNALTSIPMIILGIGALVDTKWMSGWVPMFLRVWWMYDCIVVLLDYPQVCAIMEDITRQTIRLLSRMAAIMCTCIGTHQIVESCCGTYMDLYISLYMMVAAFATIGFGDYSPKSTPARIFMVGFLIIGIAHFLPLFQWLSWVSSMKEHYNTYSVLRNGDHVLICGEFTDASVEILLRNFYAGWRKYIKTNIVLMTPNEITNEVRLVTNLPWYKGRVHLMVGEPSNMKDLRRAAAEKADAVFLFGNTRSSAYYHDYDLISQSMVVGLYDSDLPQHLLLHRAATVRQIAPFAASVLELERTTHSLLGLSMVNPGVVPLIVNLLRTYEPVPYDALADHDWLQEYEYSIRNNVYALDVPTTLLGKRFLTVAHAFAEKNTVLIGQRTVDGVVKLIPPMIAPNAIRLLVIATSLRIAEEAVSSFAASDEMHATGSFRHGDDPTERFVEMVKKQVSPKSVRRMEPALAEAVVNDENTFALEEPHEEWQREEGHRSDERDQSSAPYVEEVTDPSDLNDFFLLIDLSSAKAKSNETRYGREASLASAAHDIYNIMYPINQAYPNSEVVLLTTDTAFIPYFEEHCSHYKTSFHSPLKLVKGCGLNPFDLGRCNLDECKGCTIFFSCDISREGSTSAMAMLVDRTLHDFFKGPPPFPVVVEFEGLANVQLFPPFAEGHMRSKAEADFVFLPHYVIGNAVSRQMLYPMLVQGSYFMEEFIDVMDTLIRGYDAATPAIARIAVSAVPVELRHYSDVVAYCVGVGLVPIALHRIIHDRENPELWGNRFIFTNPPFLLPVYHSDEILYLTSSK